MSTVPTLEERVAALEARSTSIESRVGALETLRARSLLLLRRFFAKMHNRQPETNEL